MKLNRSLIALIAGTQFTVASFGADEVATNQNADIEALKQQIQELDQKVRALEQQHELDQQADADFAKTQPKLILGANGFSFSSADSNFVAALHGLIQTDSRTFVNDGGSTLGKNSFVLRRARPIFTGTLFHNFDFNFTPDFGGSAVVIYDAYLNYHYNSALQLEAGRFKSPVGLEALQSDVWTSFNERSIASDLVPNRDIGFELHGDLFGGVLGYAAGIFDGAPDYSTPTSTSDVDDDKAFAGRLFFQPWKTSGKTFLQGLGFGVGGSYGDDRQAATTSSLTSGYKTDGQQTFFSYASPAVIANGTHWRVSPQGYYYYGSFNFLGEYVISDQRVSTAAASADLQNKAWQISAGWILTGEDASYNGLTPRHPFDPQNGGWGAWQIVARYADLDIDGAAFPTFASAGSASEAKAWSVGLNWYLNRDIRANLSFSRTTFAGGVGAPSAVTKQPENAIFTRIQLAF